MINSKKIDEWIREVEERPGSASMIIHYIARRLSDLTSRNEELLAENLALRLEKKVEDYETKIANLEYQVDLLKRQLGSASGLTAGVPTTATTNLLVYNGRGQVLRVEIDPAQIVSDSEVASFSAAFDPAETLPRLQATGSQDELLFIFDSGRSVTLPVASLPPASPQALEWEQSYLVEPRGDEQLAAVIPIGKMVLFDYCVQASRRGYVKKIRRQAFQTHVTTGYVGTGAKLPADKTCDLIFCQQDDLVVLASHEGYLQAVEQARLPFTIEEVLRLGPTDHIVAASASGQKPELLVLTQTGKAIHREKSWLEPSVSFKSKGQAVFSKEKRQAGVRVVWAGSVAEQDWAAVLTSHGQLMLYQVGQLLGAGSVPLAQDGTEITGFATFALAVQPHARGSAAGGTADGG